MFTSKVGTPIDPRNLLQDCKKVLSYAGLPEMRFPDLRHTSITMDLNELEAPIKEAQHRAGHSRPSTTIDIYGGEVSSKLDEKVVKKENPFYPRLYLSKVDLYTLWCCG